MLLLIGLALLGTGRAATGLRAGEPTLRVMSFNLRYATAPDKENAWDQRKELLLETIQKFDPDLLGTQEVLAQQVDFLPQRLDGYALVGVGRDDGQRQGEFSAVLYRKARFTPLDSGTFWLSETPEQPGSKSWDSSLPRVATWAKLRDRAAGDRELCFLNTHWDHRGNQARLESARRILDWIREHAANMPVIVTGDFNVTEDHDAYKAIVSQTANGPRLYDSFRLLHPSVQPEEATFHGFTGKASGRRIDFILHTGDLTAVEAAIDRHHQERRYPSDHFPVTAILRLK